MTATMTEPTEIAHARTCDMSDLPAWLCPHCPEFEKLRATQAEKNFKPSAPEPVTVAGYWSIEWNGRAGHSRRWQAIDTDQGDRHTKVLGAYCSDTHGGEDQLCGMCTERLANLLADIPALLHDLDLAITRDTTFVQHGSRQSDHRAPSPDAAVDLQDSGFVASRIYDPRASRAQQQLIEALDAILFACGISVGGHARDFAVRAAALGLATFARRPDARHLAARLSTAVVRAHEAIDRPADLWCYGPCPTCGDDIYADRVDPKDPDATIACPKPDCPYTAKAREHQKKILDANASKLLTVAELVGALAWAGQTATRDQINGWIRRGRLEQHQLAGGKWVDGELVTTTKTVYKLADAFELATDTQRRKEKRDA